MGLRLILPILDLQTCGLRWYFPQTGRVYISRHVIFDETFFQTLGLYIVPHMLMLILRLPLFRNGLFRWIYILPIGMAILHAVLFLCPLFHQQLFHVTTRLLLVLLAIFRTNHLHLLQPKPSQHPTTSASPVVPSLDSQTQPVPCWAQIVLARPS